MHIHVADHPLVAYKLTELRDARTDSPTFRRLADELVTLLAYEATRRIRTVPCEVRTPVATAAGTALADPKPLVVPILRAGLGMLEGMVRLLPTAEVGFLGMVRDEESLVATTYADRLPSDLTGRQVYVLDPMLATGGTLVAAIELLFARGATDVIAVCLLAAPEGLRRVESAFGSRVDVSVVTAGLDERLNDKGYIVPGARRRRGPALRRRLSRRCAEAHPNSGRTDDGGRLLSLSAATGRHATRGPRTHPLSEGFRTAAARSCTARARATRPLTPSLR